MADFAEEKERGKVVDDLGQNPLMEKVVSGVSQCFPSFHLGRRQMVMIIIILTSSG